MSHRSNGGGRGIRTPGTVSRTAVFKTACFNHSHIPPHRVGLLQFSSNAMPAISELHPTGTRAGALKTLPTTTAQSALGQHFCRATRVRHRSPDTRQQFFRLKSGLTCPTPLRKMQGKFSRRIRLCSSQGPPNDSTAAVQDETDGAGASRKRNASGGLGALASGPVSFFSGVLASFLISRSQFAGHVSLVWRKPAIEQ